MPEGAQGGNTGTTKAIVTTVFKNRLRDLQEQAKKLQNAYQGKHQRVWQIPKDFGASSLLAIAQLHKPSYDREEINTKYDEVTNDPDNAGTTGDVIALKLQLDYVACEERAFRARHTTLCRAMALGHGRRFGQGHGQMWGAKPGSIEDEVASFIKAGGAT